ncbi:hypothetical protein M0R04_10160 [Candidatus Dojkabacteria bacterium]|jgi:hypothetical protein|nr:hypothetical protein [Candidatus Dojkabacteria bacterium]
MNLKIKSIEEVLPLIDRFFQENGRYPTAVDFNVTDYLPSARLIQRRFGGLSEFRKQLNFPITDYSRGEYKINVLKEIGKRGLEEENKMFNLLVKQFGRMKVHREYLLYENGRSRCDFYIFDKVRNIIVDAFFPKDKYSFDGCVRSKKYRYRNHNGPEKIIFVQMNPDIKIESNNNFYEVMSLPHFKKFISML